MDLPLELAMPSKWATLQSKSYSTPIEYNILISKFRYTGRVGNNQNNGNVADT